MCSVFMGQRDKTTAFIISCKILFVNCFFLCQPDTKSWTLSGCAARPFCANIDLSKFVFSLPCLLYPNAVHTCTSPRDPPYERAACAYVRLQPNGGPEAFLARTYDNACITSAQSFLFGCVTTSAKQGGSAENCGPLSLSSGVFWGWPIFHSFTGKSTIL